MCTQKTLPKHAHNNKEGDSLPSRDHDDTAQNDVIAGSDVINMAGEVTSSEKRSASSAAAHSTLNHTRRTSRSIIININISNIIKIISKFLVVA